MRTHGDIRIVALPLALALGFASTVHAQSWSLAGTLTRDGMPMDWSFGLGSATDGETIMISAYNEASSVDYAGAVYVYAVNGLQLLQRLELAVPERSSQFGFRPCFRGDQAVISSGKLDGSYVVFWHEQDGTWVEGQRIDATGPANSGAFGHALALGDGVAIVGAPKEAGDTGAVYVYGEDAGGSYVERQQLRASDAMQSDFFGISLALSGDTLVVGAPGNLLYPSERGFVDVFVEQDGTWMHHQRLTFPEAGGPPDVYFGGSVAIDGDTLVVSAAPGPDKMNNGRAIVFTRSGDDWSFAQALAMPEDEQFGVPVLLQGDTLFVGSGDALMERSYHVFTRQAGSFVAGERLVIEHPEMSIVASPSFAGGTFVIGVGNDGATGRALVYRNPSLDDVKPVDAPTHGGAPTGSGVPAGSAADASEDGGGGCSVSTRGHASTGAHGLAYLALAILSARRRRHA